MRRAALAIAALALAGCDFRAKAAAELKHAEMDRRILELEVRIERLEAENRILRQDIEAERLRMVQDAADAAAISAGPGPRCKGDETGTSFTIARADVDSYFADAATMSREVRIVPYFKDGSSQGFKLFSIRPGSFYASCGIRNGDILKTVNGYELASPDKALDAYTKMKGAKRATLELERNGSPVIVTIDIEN